MQALGSYQGKRMLFLGLGTGLGSAFIVDGVLEPMELAHLPYKKGRTYEDYVGLAGLKRLGKKKWRRHVNAIVKHAQDRPGGGLRCFGRRQRETSQATSARHCCLGDNANAFRGGIRLWSTARTRRAKERFVH